jgi:hypothetical protein
MNLRPLSLGEQLDRAVTLCVRNAPTFLLIYLVIGVPVAVFQIYGTQDQSRAIDGFVDMLRLQKTPNAKELSALQSPFFNGFTATLLCLYVFVGPLVQATLIFAASREYFGSHATFQSAYREGVRFWLPIIGINVLYVIIFVMLYIIASLIGIVGVVAAGLLSSVSHWLGILFGVVGGGFLSIAVFGTSLLLLVALNLSYFTCIVERIGFFSAFARGAERAFSSANIQRSLLAALAVGAIYIGIALVSMAGVAMIYGFLRSNVLGAAFTALTHVGMTIFVTVFFCVYYFDMRVRREGLDLQQEIAETMPATQ